MPKQYSLGERQKGCLQATALGDAIGLPVEKTSPEVAARYAKEKIVPWLKGEGHMPEEFDYFEEKLRFGQVSDDTMFSLALHWCLEEGWSIERWVNEIRDLPERLKVVGMGKGTLWALENLKKGVPHRLSGLPMGRATNGSIMRVVIVGAHILEPWKAAEVAAEQSVPTHRDPRCIEAAGILGMFSSLLAHDLAPQEAWNRTQEKMGNLVSDDVLLYMRLARDVAQFPAGAYPSILANTPERIQSSWQGISPYCLATMAWSVGCFLYTQDFPRAMEVCLEGGGDTDSTCAITGALLGLHDPQNLPERCLGVLHHRGRPLEWAKKVREV